MSEAPIIELAYFVQEARYEQSFTVLELSRNEKTPFNYNYVRYVLPFSAPRIIPQTKDVPGTTASFSFNSRSQLKHFVDEKYGTKIVNHSKYSTVCFSNKNEPVFTLEGMRILKYTDFIRAQLAYDLRSEIDRNPVVAEGLDAYLEGEVSWSDMRRFREAIPAKSE